MTWLSNAARPPVLMAAPKYSDALRRAITSHGFAPIPVYSSLVIQCEELFSNSTVLVMDGSEVQVRHRALCHLSHVSTGRGELQRTK